MDIFEFIDGVIWVVGTATIFVGLVYGCYKLIDCIIKKRKR